MKDYKYTESELKSNKVLTHQKEQLEGIDFEEDRLDDAISSSEKLLESLGYGDEVESAKNRPSQPIQWDLTIPSWEDMCKEAEKAIDGNCSLLPLFSEEELLANKALVNQLNEDFNSIHNLDKTDALICVAAGILSAVVDILLVGVPGPSATGTKAGPLSDYVRKQFEKKFPPEEMAKLAEKKFVKTPYDAQDNRNTSVDVEGLSSYYHRLVSLGHDPILGWVIGVIDIMKGQMTTIDKKGRIVVQVVAGYSDRKEMDFFKALSKQFLHLKSDIVTPMGLPAPFMGLFNLLQFGNIGEENNTIAEVVQGMYYEGYDFIQFCSSSIPVMLTELIVRLSWSIRRLKNGCSIKESIPASLNRSKTPKLASMLFLAHSVASAINAGKVYFTKNPTAINYPQWLAFANYSFRQLKWWVWQKANERDKYVMGKIDAERNDILAMIDKEFDSFGSEVNQNQKLIVIG